MFMLLAAAVLPAVELSLADAARIALLDNPSLAAARGMEAAAESRISQTEALRRPRIQFQESAQGGNNPVYVFSSLLSQRQFGSANFAIPVLVRPAPLQNFQSQLTLEQSVADFGRSAARRREAEAGSRIATEERRRRELEILVQTARAYSGAQLASAGLVAAEQALRSLEASHERAVALRRSQMATDADVLAVDVQLAAAQEEIIRRRQQRELAVAALNQALGQPLETGYTLTTPLAGPAVEPPAAPAQRPEVRMSILSEEAAKARQEQAAAMLRPEIGLRLQLEADRQNFITKGGANWVATGSLRWNLFDGGAARHLRAEASHTAAAAAAETRAVTSAAAMQLRQAEAAIRAAQARETVTAAAIGQARETVRIIRNRYGAGLATMTELLRAESALLESETRRLAALHDLRLSRIEREAAAGTLNGDSNVLR